MIGRINTPAQPLLGGFDGGSLELCSNRAAALDPDRGGAGAILSLVNGPGRGLDLHRDHSHHATTLQDLMGGDFQFLGVQDFLALLAVIELADFRHRLPESLIEVLRLTRRLRYRAHDQPPLPPRHRVAVHRGLQIDTYLIAVSDPPRWLWRFRRRLIDRFQSLRTAKDRRQQLFQLLSGHLLARQRTDIVIPASGHPGARRQRAHRTVANVSLTASPNGLLYPLDLRHIQ